MHELVDVYNIVSENPSFIKYEDFVSEEAVNNKLTITKVNKDKQEFFMEAFKNIFMYYNVNQSIGKNIPSLKKSINVYFPDNLTAKNIKFLTFPRKEFLPEEIHVGNILINDIEDPQPVILYSVEVSGMQAQVYQNYLKNIKSEDLLFEEDENTISIHDGFIPPSKQYQQHRIYTYEKVLLGDFFKLENLKQYSAIGYEMCILCRENAFNNEKSIVYHTKIYNFGIKQYCTILEINGFIEYNSNPQEKSLCKVCRKYYNEHNADLESRLNNRVCNQFKPLVYAVLTGNVNQSDRETLTNLIYNNPLNLYGDLITVMFVSDVAYSGVNFLNTQNMLILSKITNISKWKQIFARIIRTGSHNLLKQKYAKIFTFVIQLPNEQQQFPIFNDRTFEELFYKKNELSNIEIEKFLKNISKVCISETLLRKPESYKPDVYEVKVFNKLLLEDLERELKNVIRRVFITAPSSIWQAENFISRIQDPENNVIYFNLSKISTVFIQSFIINNHDLIPFKYENSDKGYIKIILPDDSRTDFNFINFNEFETLTNKKGIIKELLDRFDVVEKTDKLLIIVKLLKHMNRDYTPLATKHSFWKFMYEIGNEYYSDDEQNFILNHSSSARSFTKMAGCYYNSVIIHLDGSYKELKYSFPTTTGKEGFPFIFKINCMAISTNTPFYLHVKIVRFNTESVEDRRKLFKGISCFTTELDDVFKHFPSINRKFNKKQYCTELLYKICDLQLNTKEKIVYTPFEK
jgi:hypothetical protein